MKSVLAILLTTAWISLCEFVRNEYFLKQVWINHYSKLGLNFPDEPLNGAVWGVWSLMYAIAVWWISKKFSFNETVVLSWFVAFPLMWVALWNLMVLPVGILFSALPLSFAEAFGAAFICHRFIQGKFPKLK